jgi:hypothetical protein
MNDIKALWTTLRVEAELEVESMASKVKPVAGASGLF